jgi:beta-glucanase (GH16 family)
MPSNVWYEDGKLVLRAYVDNHTGGEYKSNDAYTYGRYTASMKFCQTPGTYGAFFSYQWPTTSLLHSEIDVEVYRDENTLSNHMVTTWVNYQPNRQNFLLDFDPGEDYHVYSYDWYPDHVDFYLDDMSTPVWTSYSDIPEEPLYVYFQNWVLKYPPSNHGDGVNTVYVDWVTVEPH